MQTRYARPDEFDQVLALDAASFGIAYSEQDAEDARLDLDLDRLLVTVDDGRVVAVSGEVPFELTLPGSRIDVTGLTWVSVEATHRRRGLLRGLLERQVRSCETAALILTASEGGIYGRYGFGTATLTRKTVVDRRRAQLRTPAPTGGVRRLDTEAARALLPGLYDRWRRETPGGLDRAGHRWTFELLDREHQRRGGSALQHLVHDDGYASYRVIPDWNDGDPRHRCVVVDYAPCTPEAHAALWQVLLALDLCATVESFRVPADDPLPLLLTDPRQVRTAALDDGLWVRPVDVTRLLSSRRYAVDVDVVLTVLDPLLGDRTVRLVGGPSESSCTGSTADADLVLGVDVLGAVVLGGTRLTQYAAAGRVHGRADTVRMLDRALLADRAPEYGTHF